MDIVEYARQGDVKIDRVDRLPSAAMPLERHGGTCIVAYGELTGHRHYFRDEHAQLYSAGDRLYLVIEREPATLLHEEHDPITFAPGVYEIRRQREWSEKGQPVRVCG